MLFIIISFLMAIIALIFKIRDNKKHNSNTDQVVENNRSGIENVLLGIVLFVPVFVLCFISITFILSIIFSFILGSQSGEWAYAMIIAAILSPILTIISVVQTLSKGGKS